MGWLGLTGNPDNNEALAERYPYRGFVITVYHYDDDEVVRHYLRVDAELAVDAVIKKGHVKRLESERIGEHSPIANYYITVLQASRVEGKGLEMPDGVKPLGACNVEWVDDDEVA